MFTCHCMPFNVNEVTDGRTDRETLINFYSTLYT